MLFTLGTPVLATAQTGCDAGAQQSYERQHFEEVESALSGRSLNDCDLRLLALSQFRMNDYGAALPAVSFLLATHPADRDLNRAALVMYTGQGATADAEAAARVLDSIGDSDFANLYRARVSEQLGETSRAEYILHGLLNARDPALAQEAADDLIALLQSQGRHGEVAAVAETALARDPGSFNAYRLEQYARHDPDGLRPLVISIGYRLDYDDNVALLPDEQGVIFGVPDEEDFRHVLFGDLMYRKPLGASLMFFAEGHFSHAFHNDLDEYDFTHVNVLAGLGGSYDRWGWRLPVEYTHDRFDGDSFRDLVIATPGVYVDLWSGLQSHLYGRFISADYERSVSLSEDRSGDVAGGGLLVAGSLGDRWTLRLFGEVDEFDTDGDNWDRDEWRVQALVEFEVAPNWTIGAGARYQEADFDNLHDVFLERRKDETSSAFASVSHWFRDHWQIRAQASYVDQESTLAVYDYDRTVISLGVSYDF